MVASVFLIEKIEKTQQANLEGISIVLNYTLGKGKRRSWVCLFETDWKKTSKKLEKTSKASDKLLEGI